MLKIKVELKDRSYLIFIGADILSSLPEEFISLFAKKKCLIVTDSNVYNLYAESFLNGISKKGIPAKIFSFPAGEKSKNFKTYQEILKAALSAGLDRKSAILALGGGVTGDLAGFASATYMRGIDYIQIPTTLLAMVDSSVGGKTGIDLREGKNLVGAFWQPKIVLADINVLQTLDEREFKCGLSEIVKYGVILDEKFFDLLENESDKVIKRDPEIIIRMVERSCQLKAQVVGLDEREESGLRAILNYGHTFGHAIETLTSYGKYNHGEAVAIGMALSAKFAVSSGMLDKNSFNRIVSLLKRFSLPYELQNIDSKDIINVMKRDKKSVSGEINLVVPSKIGKVSVIKAKENDIIKVLELTDF